jgi:hypothetical protein
MPVLCRLAASTGIVHVGRQRQNEHHFRHRSGI